MARPRTRNDVVCQNKSCKFFRKKTDKDIVRRGFNKKGTQRYYCNHCRHYFVETSGTPLYRKRLPQNKINELCRAIVEKNGIRATSRITQLSTPTIMRWHDDLAEHAMQVNSFLTKNLGLAEYEVDEFWTTVKKNRKRTAQLIPLPREKAKNGGTHASKGTRISSRRLRLARGRRKHVGAS